MRVSRQLTQTFIQYSLCGLYGIMHLQAVYFHIPKIVRKLVNILESEPSLKHHLLACVAIKITFQRRQTELRCPHTVH